MRRVLAIARLTFAEGVRMRIVLVFLVVLVLLVLYMPFALRGDETLAGRLQNFLAYSLGALALLLSLATIFFSCATLTREFSERSLHLVVTKPVTRLQILLGKWLGVNLLNLLIVVLCGAAIYGFASFIRSQPEQFQRDRYKVRDVVWTARYAARPVVPESLIQAVEREVDSRIETGEIRPTEREQARMRRYGELLRQWRLIQPQQYGIFSFENLSPPEREDTVIQVRYKAIGTPLPPGELIDIGWVFCEPDTGAPLHTPTTTRERSGDVHQFLVTAGRVIFDGRAELRVLNAYTPPATTSILFEGEDSLLLLYKVGSFEVNYVKALLLILMRLGLLSAVGLCFGVFVSFPVACLCASVFYVICLGMPFWMESIGANMQVVMPSIDPYGAWGPQVRAVLVSLLRVFFPDFTYYDGTNHLVEGEFITYTLLGWAVLRTLIYGGLLLVAGWLVFRLREVASVQV